MRAVSLRMRPKVAISIVSPNVLGPRLRSMNDVISSSRKNPEILVKPMIASTLPSALVRSPRRANGLNSGSTFERLRGTPLETHLRGEVDVEARLGRGFEVQVQRRAPLGKLLCDPLEVARCEVAGVHELQHEHALVFVLDRGYGTIRQHRDGLPLDLRRAGHLEQRVHIGPFRRDPLLVAK